MTRMSSPEKYLKPEVIRQVARLDLRARFIVEGFLAGLHASPFHGFSVEFSEHRRYAPGDDVKDLDWTVYAKTERYYVKKFQAETNVTGYLAMDLSGSMAYTYRQELTKFEYAICLAAGHVPVVLSLVAPEGSCRGLALFGSLDSNYRKPGSSPQGGWRARRHSLSSRSQEYLQCAKGNIADCLDRCCRVVVFRFSQFLLQGLNDLVRFFPGVRIPLGVSITTTVGVTFGEAVLEPIFVPFLIPKLAPRLESFFVPETERPLNDSLRCIDTSGVEPLDEVHVMPQQAVLVLLLQLLVLR